MDFEYETRQNIDIKSFGVILDSDSRVPREDGDVYALPEGSSIEDYVALHPYMGQMLYRFQSTDFYFSVYQFVTTICYIQFTVFIFRFVGIYDVIQIGVVITISRDDEILLSLIYNISSSNPNFFLAT